MYTLPKIYVVKIHLFVASFAVGAGMVEGLDLPRAKTRSSVAFLGVFPVPVGNVVNLQSTKTPA